MAIRIVIALIGLALIAYATLPRRGDVRDGVGGDRTRSAYFTPSTDPAYDLGAIESRPRDGQFTLRVIEGQTIKVQSSEGESVYVVISGRLARLDNGQYFTPAVRAAEPPQ